MKLAFHGALSPEEKQKLHAVARCPIHKLMTSTTIEIVIAPLEPAGH